MPCGGAESIGLLRKSLAEQPLDANLKKSQIAFYHGTYPSLVVSGKEGYGRTPGNSRANSALTRIAGEAPLLAIETGYRHFLCRVKIERFGRLAGRDS